jgi:hypothetical protein
MCCHSAHSLAHNVVGAMRTAAQST